MVWLRCFWILSLLLPLRLWSSEQSTYEFKWLDPDKEVYVLQNRKFRKVSKFYAHLGGGFTTSGAFADAKVVQARAGFFIREDWGVEFVYSKNSSSTNETYDAVAAQGAVPFVRQTQGYLGAMVVWSPFYAKINTFNQIYYFDWFFGLGAGSITEENNRNDLNETADGNTTNDAVGDASLTEETHTGVMWMTSFRFYLSQNWGVRLGLLAIHYKANKAFANSGEEAFYNNLDFTAGVDFTF